MRVLGKCSRVECGVLQVVTIEHLSPNKERNCCICGKDGVKPL